MQGEDVGDFFATLTKRVRGGDSSQTADAAVATWQGMSAALSPIIGTGGFAALYERSLSRTRQDYPWLEAVLQGALAPADFGPLHQALSQQDNSGAAAASATLLRTFCDLLARLIGPSLTVRLLRSPSTSVDSSGVHPQDPTP